MVSVDLYVYYEWACLKYEVFSFANIKVSTKLKTDDMKLTCRDKTPMSFDQWTKLWCVCVRMKQGQNQTKLLMNGLSPGFLGITR